MASISSVGNFSLPTEQPVRKQAARPITPTENKLADQQGKRTTDQQTAIRQNDKIPDQLKEETSNTKPPLSNEEKQKFEAAQQEAQRAEFNQQAGNVRETEPNDVRPPLSDFRTLVQNNEEESTPVLLIRDRSLPENTAIDTFNTFQNINAASRQGQSLDKFV